MGGERRRTRRPPLGQPLLLSFRFPVLQELLQPSICQRVFEERLKHAVRHRANVAAGQGGLDNMLRMADARD